MGYLRAVVGRGLNIVKYTARQVSWSANSATRAGPIILQTPRTSKILICIELVGRIRRSRNPPDETQTFGVIRFAINALLNIAPYAR